MSTPDDYRAMAEECFRWARQAQTEDKRQAYLECGPDVARSRVGPRLWPSRSDANPVAAQFEALMGAVSIAVLAQQRVNCGDTILVLYDAANCRPRLRIAANIAFRELVCRGQALES